MAIVVWIAGGLLLLVTILPLLPSDDRFIRVWDFPRAQVSVLLAVALAASLVVLDVDRWPALLWCGLLALALGYQLYRIFPYTPAHAVQVVDTAGEPGCEASTIRLLVANVRQSNRRSAAVLREIAGSDADLVLFLETDAWWTEQLEAPLRQRYPHVVSQPQDDGYGMLLMSRLPLIAPSVRFLLQDYVPSIKTGVRLGSGTVIDFYAVHPKPPPLHDTEMRDAELLLVGREVRDTSNPAIVAGDLNDVAWSDTTRLFQDISGMLDPRVGRGLYSTYNANWPFMRWPVDHVFFESVFTLRDMRRLGPVGSDHFPFYISLCHQPAAADRQAQPAADRKQRRRAEELIREGVGEADEQD